MGESHSMRVLIVGAGYVGLSTGVILALKHKVTLMDIDIGRVQSINRGQCPIIENNLERLLRETRLSGNLSAIHVDGKVTEQDVILICVGTPQMADGSVNLDFLSQAVEMLLERVDEWISEFTVIGIKSTVPPGTCRSKLLSEIPESLKARIGAVFNPEFLREGSAIEDSLNPDRVIIGASDSRSFSAIKEMYRECLRNPDVPYVETNLETAELSKYVSNSFLATKISFANEVANLAEKIPGVDLEDVMKLVGMDHRISSSFFKAGAGYGGSCFPKDVAGLIRYAKGSFNVDLEILGAVQTVNSDRPKKLIQMLKECVGDIRGRKLALLGLAFKPGTDDIRESPTLKIVGLLHDDRPDIWVHDPLMAKIRADSLSDKVAMLTDNIDECTRDAYACMLITDWSIYKEIGLEELTNNMKNRVFIDGRRVFAKAAIPKGIIYRVVGTYHESKTT